MADSDGVDAGVFAFFPFAFGFCGGTCFLTAASKSTEGCTCDAACDADGLNSACCPAGTSLIPLACEKPGGADDTGVREGAGGAGAENDADFFAAAFFGAFAGIVYSSCDLKRVAGVGGGRKGGEG